MLSLGLDENWTQERIKEFINQVVINGNEWIDFNEGIFNQYIDQQNSIIFINENIPGLFLCLFAHMDKDASGFISNQELKKFPWN